jgi:hypothetical protein
MWKRLEAISRRTSNRNVEHYAQNKVVKLYRYYYLCSEMQDFLES